MLNNVNVCANILLTAKQKGVKQMSEIGKEMLEYRARNRLSQVKLAELLGMKQRSICQIELGKQKPRQSLVVRFELLKKGEL